MLVVSEIMPSTMVGDGPYAGCRCALIRLGGCNLACTWCDVPHSWDATRFDIANILPRRLVRNVIEEALSEAPGLVLITGGEPLLQQRSPGWSALLAGLREARVAVEAHTNGTIAPGPAALETVHRFVVSPKLSHSGEPAWTRIDAEALAAWSALAQAGRALFSFVVRDRGDVYTVTSLATLHAIPHHAIWISPEATTPARLIQITTDVADSAVRQGFNLGTRTSVLAGTSTTVVA
jgi:organic radical activating enzyme